MELKDINNNKNIEEVKSEMSNFQFMKIVGNAQRYEEENNKNDWIHKEYEKPYRNTIIEITRFSEDIQIIKEQILFKNREKFYQGNEFVYNVAVDGKIQNQSSFTKAQAILIALGIKYDGLNSQFASFASKMLNIK